MNSKSKPFLALVLSILIATAGCSAQWINTALQDLPVLTQMALNIATLVSTLAAGQQASTGDIAVIQNISAQASRDLNLLQTLYSEYKAGPSATTLKNQDRGCGESDSDYREQFCRFDATVFCCDFTQNFLGASPSCERVEEAMEPAGLCAYRQSCAGCGIRVKRAAVAPHRHADQQSASPRSLQLKAFQFDCHLVRAGTSVPLLLHCWSPHVLARNRNYQRFYLPL